MSEYSSQQIDDVLNAVLADESLEDQAAATIAGKYVVQQLIACDGQATVVEAWDATLCRAVILKIYHDSLSQNQKTRIVNEGRALANITSPYVVQCFGVEELQGTMFLVLEYIQGVRLSEYLATHRPSEGQLVRLFSQLVEGIDSAHRGGVLHLDLKPSNVLVTNNDDVKLIDFGLVQSIAADQISVGSGTPAFMPPELARQGESVDERTDVFGLGAILFYMLTRRALYEAESVEQQRRMAQAGLTQPIVIPIDGTYSTAIKDLCARCLQTASQERPPVEAIATELQGMISTPKPNSALSPLLTLGLLLAVLVLGGLSLNWWLNPAGQESDVTPSQNVAPTDDHIRGIDIGTVPELVNTLKETIRQADRYLQQGELSSALESSQRAVQLSESHVLAEYFLAECQARYSCFANEFVQLNQADQESFQLCLQQIDVLKNSFQAPNGQTIQDALQTFERQETEQKLGELLGARHLFSQIARATRVRASEILLYDGLSTKPSVLDDMVQVADEFQELLGANSELSLYFREGVANLFLHRGQLVNAEKAFEKIFQVTKNSRGHGMRYAAQAQLQRSLLLLNSDPAAADDCFQYYEKYHRQITRQIPKDDIRHTDIPFFRTRIEYTNLRFDDCVTYGREALKRLSHGDSRQHLMRRTATYAFLSSAYAHLAAAAESVSQQDQFKGDAKHWYDTAVTSMRQLPGNSELRLSVKNMLVEGLLEIGEWDNALAMIDETINELKETSHGTSPNSKPTDGLVLTLIGKLDLANRAGYRELAATTAEEIKLLIERVKPVWYEHIANRAIVVAFKNSGQTRRAIEIIDQTIELLNTSSAVDFPNKGSLEMDLEWFKRTKKSLESKLPSE